MHAVVAGAGSWGTALAILLARNGHEVTLLGRNASDLDSMRAGHENRHYLPGFAIPADVRFGHLRQVVEPSDLTVVAVPSGAVRDVAADLGSGHPKIVVAAKGLEASTGATMAEVVADVLPDAAVGVLSGPNLAVEIVRGVPTAAIAASVDLAFAEAVRQAFMCSSFRVYLSDDVTGVELAGALKNVLAIAAGMSDGLGYGDNTKGALLARGLREMILLGLAMGARQETFLGIAGIGDLFATASSSLSRNYRVGRAVGEGRSVAEALEGIGQVAEGVATSSVVAMLAERHGVEMPVFAAVQAVLDGRLEAKRGVQLLMERTTPFEGLPAR